MKRVLTTITAAAAMGLACAGPAAAADSCANDAFRTGPSARLPDCRAYEQISPTDKAGNDVSPFRPTLKLGSTIFYGSDGGFAGAEATALYNTYAATRGADWTTLSTDVPLANDDIIFEKTTLGYSDDGTKALVVSDRKYTSGAIEGGGNVYVRDLSQPRAFRLVAASANRTFAYRLAQYTQNALVATTGDLSAVAFQSTVPLLPGVPDDGNTYLYLWHDGQLSLASRDPSGAPLASYEQQGLVAGTPLRSVHVLSDDGTRLMWTANDTHALYQYVEGEGATLISRAQAPGANPQEPINAYGNFATPDGRTITFSTQEQIAPGVTASYRWSADDAPNAPLARLPLPNGATVDFVSADLRYTWFSEVGQELSPGVFGDAYSVLDAQTGAARRYTGFPQFGTRPANLRFSPDGHRIIFQSKAPLTGVDNTGATCKDPFVGNQCSNLFTYDADSPSEPLACVSCVPGVVNRGDTTLNLDTIDGLLGNSFFDDGRVFFDTPNALVAADVNTVNDVYEYAPGSGLKLVSPGRSDFAVSFRDATSDGTDVLMATGEGLVPQDDDGLIDLYTARAGGGIASQQIAPGAASEGCSGEDCRASARPQPGLTVPGTSEFVAPPKRVAPTFSYRRPSARVLRLAGRTGRFSLPVKVNVAGRVSASLSGRLGGSRTVTVARASTRASKAGTVRLTLRLSKRARAVLARKGRVALRLTVRFSERDGASVRTLTFTTGRTASKAKGGAR